MWRFLYTYFYRLGFLDGAGGFQYCAMISIYEYWTELKIKELARPWGDATQRLTEKMMREPGGKA